MKKLTIHLTFLIFSLTILPFSPLFNSEINLNNFSSSNWIWKWLKIIIVKYIFEVNNF